MLDALVEDIVERVASAVVQQLTASRDQEIGEWLDSRTAADYLGVHRDTLRKLAAERTIAAHQDGPDASCSSSGRISTTGARPADAPRI